MTVTPALPSAPAAPESGAERQGRFIENIVHFGRALRLAGLRVGPGQLTEAVRAANTVEFTCKEDFRWLLHACLVTRNEHRQVFDQIFRLFWRDPRLHEHMMAMLLPMVRGAQRERKAEAGGRRAADALLGGTSRDAASMDDSEAAELELNIDASGTSSGRERLGALDFEQMSNEEMSEARRILESFSLPAAPLRSRRMTASPHGRHADWQATIRQAMRQGGEVCAMARRRQRTRWPNLVAICDISGSMAVYSRTLLRFLNAVSTSGGEGWNRVHAFTFGTRLTNISRQLKIGDPDTALAAAGAEAQDWDGGTRIGECIRAFNRDWSRRVMGQGAVVLLISDGLDSGCTDLLERETVRLRLSSKRLVWINPLLRWDGFAPKAAGIVAMLPHVDCLRTAHNLNSLEELAGVVANSRDQGDKPRLLSALWEGGRLLN